MSVHYETTNSRGQREDHIDINYLIERLTDDRDNGATEVILVGQTVLSNKDNNVLMSIENQM